MSLREPDYSLIDLGSNEWRFQESQLMLYVTERFDQIRESGKSDHIYASRLKRLIRDYPTHIDALHHYGLVQSSKGKAVDAYVYFQTAVAVGKSVFTEEFLRSKGRLPGGFVTNRPFLRAIHGLMYAQAVLGDYCSAVKSGCELIEFDLEDRMGARLELPLYHLYLGDYDGADRIFQIKRFEDTFHTNAYLKALAEFKLGHIKSSQATLALALQRYPQVARFILNPNEEVPANESRFGGVIGGSPFEGWLCAQKFGELWQMHPEAFDFLRIQAGAILGNKWVKYSARMSSQ